jgi:MFS family permease
MILSIAAMGLATAYWQVVGLALLSGVGNSVIHPADYAILRGSMDRAKLGRSFVFHTFAGHVGFAVAPPAAAALMLLLGWPRALLSSAFWVFLSWRRSYGRAASSPIRRGSRAAATDRHLPFVAILTVGAAALLLLTGVVSLAELPTIGVVFITGIMTGASRTPRDVMVKDAAPPADRQGVRLCQIRHVIGRRDHAGALWHDHRCRSARTRAGGRRHASAIELVMRRRRSRRVRAPAPAAAE